jgi:hypothetical protein
MAGSKDTLNNRLARYLQIKIRVIGRKSGCTISIPVWFVLEGEKLWLLPVQGSDTQWYKNVLKNPSIRIDARGVSLGIARILINGHPYVGRSGIAGAVVILSRACGT